MFLKFLIAAVGIIFVLNPARANEITFMVHGVDGKVFHDENGELRGVKHSGRRSFQLELVREMMIRLDHRPRRYKIVPFKRGFQLVMRNKEALGFFNVISLPDRKEKMKFVGPLTNGIDYIYELKSSPTGITSIEDAKNLSVCVLRGSSQDSFAVKNKFSKIIRYNYEGCFKMLLNKRVDLALVSNLDVQGVLKNANIDANLIKNTSVYFYKTADSLAFSNLVPDAVVKNWRLVLKEIKRSGTYDKLMKEYLYPN